MTKKVIRTSYCINCHFCDYFVHCSGQGKTCIGCGSCIKGCPAGARQLVATETDSTSVMVHIDGQPFFVPGNGSVETALQTAGIKTSVQEHCGTGSCYNCAVLIDEQLKKSCSTKVKSGMNITTNSHQIAALDPLRLVSFFPNHLHAAVSVFTHGCNYSCDFCHNWDITFSSVGTPSTPTEAAFYTLQAIETQPNPRVGISGGEPTLNRPWLTAYIRELKKRNKNIRIQLDTNASLLTRDYIDELFEIGVTDISPDMKGLNLETFQQISGVEDDALARKYLDTAWEGLAYLVENYTNKMFFHVGVPYHPQFISTEEVLAMGKKLVALDPNINVNLIIYQPIFRMRHADPVSDQEIDTAFDVLKGVGLKNLWCQEGADIPQGVDPDELLLMGEGF